MDYFNAMLRLQTQFQEKYKDKFHFSSHRVASAMMAESGELWGASGGKWWKKKKKTREEQIEEMADLLHFFLLFMIKKNISVKELYDAYVKKLAENYNRQERGY